MNSDVLVVLVVLCLIFFWFSESPWLVIAEAMFSKKATFFACIHKLPVSTNVCIMSCIQSSVSMAFLC